MAASISTKPDKRSNGPIYPEKLKVPRTPLESRQGYHPKKDAELMWRSPPSRQLSREKRVEYESDVKERFYDDYLGARTTGDARNEVRTGLSKLKFDPALYRANALQGLVYDPARPVPASVDLHGALRKEQLVSRQRELEEYHTRRRRMSDSGLSMRPHQLEPVQHFEPASNHRPSGDFFLPRIPAQPERPRSNLQKALDDSLNPETVPAVESWFGTASNEEKEIATKFFRTLSSHGKRPDPASRAALHRTRVRSAVHTPSHRQREEKDTQNIYQQMSRNVMKDNPSPTSSSPTRRVQYHRPSSGSDKAPAKGGLFTSTRQQPAHYTVHPDWASEHTTGVNTRK